MLHLTKLSFLFYLFTLTCIVDAKSITEQDVHELIQSVDTAIEARDAEAIGAVLGDDVDITLNINIEGQKQVLKPGKQEYLQMLRDNWKLGTNYTYLRSNIKIRLLDSKALVAADIFESISMQGHKISSDSKEEILVEWIQGKARITQMTGYSGHIDSH